MSRYINNYFSLMLLFAGIAFVSCKKELEYSPEVRLIAFDVDKSWISCLKTRETTVVTPDGETVTTGSTSFNYGNYNFYVIIGQPSSSGSRTPIVVPKAAITTSSVAYQISDESYYYSFNLYYSGSTCYLAYKGRNSSGQIIAVYGVN